jgi:hypothetical protein
MKDRKALTFHPAILPLRLGKPLSAQNLFANLLIPSIVRGAGNSFSREPFMSWRKTP